MRLCYTAETYEVIIYGTFLNTKLYFYYPPWLWWIKNHSLKGKIETLISMAPWNEAADFWFRWKHAFHWQHCPLLRLMAVKEHLLHVDVPRDSENGHLLILSLSKQTVFNHVSLHKCRNDVPNPTETKSDQKQFHSWEIVRRQVFRFLNYCQTLFIFRS